MIFLLTWGDFQVVQQLNFQGYSILVNDEQTLSRDHFKRDMLIFNHPVIKLPSEMTLLTVP